MTSSDEPLEVENPDAAAPPKGVLLTLFFVVLMDLFGFGVILPLLPFYAVEYKASALQVGFIFSLYSLCQLIASPILGLISDRYGRRPVLIFSQLGSVAGYVLLGITNALHWDNLTMALGLIYLARIIDGLSAGNISTAQAYISDVTTHETRSKGMGMLGAAFGIGFALGPAFGGLCAHFGKSLPAFAAAGFSFIAVILTYVTLPESRVHKPAEEGELFLHPSRMAFLLRKPVLLQLMGVWFFTMWAFVMMESTVTLFLSRADTFHYNETQVGWVFALAGVVIVIVQGGFIHRLTKAIGEWPMAICGPVLVAIAMLAYVRLGVAPYLPLLMGATILNATGRSLQGPSLSSLVSKFASRDEQGATFGAYQGLGSLARVIGPMVGTALFAWHITFPFMLASAMTVLVAIWTLAIRARTRTAEEPSLLVRSAS
jgi:MFS transporter, DHA1 family, tetracycline resistance protein